MMDLSVRIFNLTPNDISKYGVCGYKDVSKHIELRRKIDWFATYHQKGLQIKVLVAENGSYQGMLEYLPGEFAHRPVNAVGYMFIHCIFTGFKKEFKGKGYATKMIQECINEAKAQKMLGVAVVTRKGSFMSDDGVFMKMGFQLTDVSKPDFSLLALKFDHQTASPSFKSDVINNLNEYKKGLTIFRSVQCPYTEKNVMDIVESAVHKYNLDVRLIDIENAESAQQTPSPFGTFCIIYNGEVIAYHPISNTRFENIMNKISI